MSNNSTPRTPKSPSSSQASPLLKSLAQPLPASPSPPPPTAFSLDDSNRSRSNSAKSNANNNNPTTKKQALTSLSPYSQVFKSKIIEEFVIIDSGGSAITSATNVSDLFEGWSILSGF